MLVNRILLKKDITTGKKGSASNAYDFDSEDDIWPVRGLYKPQFNRDKSPKKYEIRKTPQSPEREKNKKAATPTGAKKSTATTPNAGGAATKKDSAQKKGSCVPEERGGSEKKTQCRTKRTQCHIKKMQFLTKKRQCHKKRNRRPQKVMLNTRQWFAISR